VKGIIIIVLLNSFNSKNLKYKMRAEEAGESKRNRKNLMGMLCCVRPCGQTDVGSSQKHLLPFRILLNIGIDPNFPQKEFFFPFLALFREIFHFPAKTFLD